MIVKSLELSDFRNYNKLNMDFSPGINILYGDNAQGKTNILEAVYMCCTTKSQKGSKEKEVIRFNNDEAHLKLIVECDGIDHKIDMHLRKSKSKGVAIDGLYIRKSSELYGFINIISFSPDDLCIIKNGPADRRRFVDMELCQLDKLYIHNLTEYNKALLQRNNLLKQLVYKRDLIDTLQIWDKQLVKYGNYVIEARRNFINEINEIAGAIHKKIAAVDENLDICYVPESDEESFLNKLSENSEKDIFLKATSTGPHRDDIEFTINGDNARRYGSQGQQRTIALALKLAEIEFVKKKTREKPILLLDDVLSELDRTRQTQLLDSISEVQTILTCTGLEEFVHNRIKYDKIYKVESGTVMQQ